MNDIEPLFSSARAIPAEGARVGLVTCRGCGAALLIDPADDFDVRELHREWHEDNGS